MQEFHYKVGWRARGQRQGFHASASQGSGMEFVGHAPLAGYSDPRRIDIRASLANPTGDWLVRLHRTRAALPVCVVLDLSASMGFAGVRRKLDVVRHFVASAGFSVRRTGDAFGLIAADDTHTRAGLAAADPCALGRADRARPARRRRRVARQRRPARRPALAAAQSLAGISGIGFSLSRSTC